MSWMQRLYDTYENNLSEVGKVMVIEESKSAILLPIFHTQIKAHIEVVIDENGKFLRANFVSSENDSVIIPCTESSNGRSGSNPKPHPLCDKLQYLAGDYQKFGGSKYCAFDLYCKQLGEWVDSKFSHPKIKAIYQYVKKGLLVQDLINVGILTCNDSDKLEEKWNKDIFPNSPNVNQEEVVIVWRVESIGVLESRTWMDRSLFDQWIAYYQASMQGIGLCQVTGKQAPLATNHPKKIYNRCANAKIISANDKDGFTYRGMLIDASAVCGISLEASQKIHSVLKWLIDRQGLNSDNKSILCWRNTNQELISPFEGTYDIFGDEELLEDSGDTGFDLATTLKKKIYGMKVNSISNDYVMLMILESATDGRLSITYYQELHVDDYFNRIEAWHDKCKWVMYSNGKTFIGTPSLKKIARTICGEGKHVDSKYIYKTIERLLPCVVEGRQIPEDMMMQAIRRVVRPEIYDDLQVHQRAIAITCAMYKKYAINYYKEDYQVGLEQERKSRDYLFGRLLAIAQSIERWALDTHDEKRMTNADRLMQRFSEHPFSTWRTIELSLRPSIERLGAKGKGREKLLDEIMSLFEPEDFVSDKKLSGEFLLGYHCQRMELFKYNKAKNTKDQEEMEVTIND